MEFQYFKYFVAVADNLSFAKASSACRVSQPALSTQIRKMEQILGCQLFHRTKRQVKLTREGVELLPRARRILLDIRYFTEHGAILSDPLAGNLVVGVSPLVSQSRAFEVLNQMSKKHTELRLHLVEDSTSQLLMGLRERKFDIIVMPYSSHRAESSLKCVAIDKGEMSYFYPKGHGKTFKELPFIGSHGGCGLRSLMEDSAQILGFKTQSPYAAHHVDMIKKWIGLGMGWSLLPKSIFLTSDEPRIAIKKPEKEVSIQYCAIMLDGERADVILKELGNPSKASYL